MIEPESAQLIGNGGTSTGAGNVVVLVIVLLAILFAAYYVTRLISGKAKFMMRSGKMQILDRLSVARDKHIMIVRVGEQAYLIGVSNASINTLAKLPDEIMDEAAPESPEGTFWSRFSGAMKENFGARASAKNQYQPMGGQKRADKGNGYDEGSLDDIAQMIKLRNERMNRRGDEE